MKYITESLADALYEARQKRANDGLDSDVNEVSDKLKKKAEDYLDKKGYHNYLNGDYQKNKLAMKISGNYKMKNEDASLDYDDVNDSDEDEVEQEELENDLGIDEEYMVTEEEEVFKFKDLKEMDDSKFNKLIRILKKAEYDNYDGYPSTVSIIVKSPREEKFEYLKIGPNEWWKEDVRTNKIVQKKISSESLAELLRDENPKKGIYIHNIKSSDDVDEARWVTMHGNHALVGDKGELLKGGDPKKRVSADKKTIDAAVKDANSKSKSEKNR